MGWKLYRRFPSEDGTKTRGACFLVNHGQLDAVCTIPKSPGFFLGWGFRPSPTANGFWSGFTASICWFSHPYSFILRAGDFQAHKFNRFRWFNQSVWMTWSRSSKVPAVIWKENNPCFDSEHADPKHPRSPTPSSGGGHRRVETSRDYVKTNNNLQLADMNTGWWLTYPSEKWWSSSVEMIFHSQLNGKS